MPKPRPNTMTLPPMYIMNVLRNLNVVNNKKKSKNKK